MPLESDAPYACPYCGESNFIGVDPSAGKRQRLVEDCPVCCGPIAFTVCVDADGDGTVESAEPA
ncbi:MAG: CPXCG motif-containing cysteine-rich protein [Candidatus Eremiobacteraeota bacterium]|nr:CPXCG motif-containing cysteine-rich protein [Candidatus Eremiobacteraeota bacterium]